MAKGRVYVETTFVSYLTAWPSRDVVIHGHQQISREWWETQRAHFELCTSELVLEEARAGDAQAAGERLQLLASIPVLSATPPTLALARQLLEGGALPAKAAADAVHIALAATHGVEYLLTWNCKHLANATMRPVIERVCRAAGYQPPIICTPEELLED
jgi:predicted nucleic acid-binding protein